MEPRDLQCMKGAVAAHEHMQGPMMKVLALRQALLSAKLKALAVEYAKIMDIFRQRIATCECRTYLCVCVVGGGCSQGGILEVIEEQMYGSKGDCSLTQQ